jgi:beta-lactamase regulating signal transducer with metallopeptidase domain
MIAAWMLYCTLCAAGLTLAAAVVERVLLAGRAPVRVVWAAALASSLAVPVMLFRVSSYATAAATPPVVTSDAAALVAVGPDHVAARPVPAATPPSDRDWRRLLDTLDRPLVVGWGLLSAALALSLVVGVLTLASRRRRWARRDAQGVSVYVSSRTGPAVVGAVKPAIVVPEWALALPPAQLSLMLRHEQEHLRARDGQLLIAAQLALIAMPWNPALWWQVVSLRVAIEMDCDARVLRHADARSYGELLLEVARPHRPFNLAGMIAFAERATQLERRIRVLHRHRIAPAPRTLLAASGIALLALTAAWIAPHPAGLARRSTFVQNPAPKLAIPRLRDVASEATPTGPLANRTVPDDAASRRFTSSVSRVECDNDTTIVGATYRLLFAGVTLTRDNESRACELLTRLADEQLAEDAVAQASAMTARANRLSIQSNRDASLMALLKSDADRATFSANLSRSSFSVAIDGRGGARGRGGFGATTSAGGSTEPTMMRGRVGRGFAPVGDTVVVARGGGYAVVADSERAALERKLVELAKMNGGQPVNITTRRVPGDVAFSTIAVDSSAMSRDERANVAVLVKDVLATMSAQDVEGSYRRLFDGISLAPDDAMSARRILDDARSQMAAATPRFAPATRLRLNPGRGVVRVVAGADSALVNLVADKDRATVRARIIAVP